MGLSVEFAVCNGATKMQNRDRGSYLLAESGNHVQLEVQGALPPEGQYAGDVNRLLQSRQSFQIPEHNFSANRADF